MNTTGTQVIDSPRHAHQRRSDRNARLPQLLRERILVLDGAMGTLIQRHELDEAEFRGERFARPPARPAGRQRACSILTQPDIIRGIHDEYLDAGADIIDDQHVQRARASRWPTTA